MRFFCLLFGFCAFAAAKHVFPQTKKGQLALLEQSRLLIELADTILKASDWSKDGQLDEAAKLADVASQIAQKLVELKAPGVKKENAEVLQTEADEAIRAAMAEDKLGFERALSAMEHQLEKILENLEKLVKDKEQELKNSSEDVAPMELAYVLLIEDSSAMTDLSAAVNQTVHGDMKIPKENKPLAIVYVFKSAKEGFKQSQITNKKLAKFSDQEENWVTEAPKFRQFQPYGSDEPESEECRTQRRFNFRNCPRHFGFRFCRRVFLRRFLNRRGYHNFFHDNENQDEM